MEADLQNTNKKISVKLSHLDGLNHVILQHNEGIQCINYYCLEDTILKLDGLAVDFGKICTPPYMHIIPLHNSWYT